MRWFVTLGAFDRPDGAIVEVAWDHGTLRSSIVGRFEPRAERMVAGKGLTGACWLGPDPSDGLAVCSFNTVERFDPERGTFEPILVRADFNDLHDVAAHGDDLWVTNTGLDRVDRFQGDVLAASFDLVPDADALETDLSDPYFGEHSAAPLHRRRLPSRVHPNSVHADGDRVIVTRLLDRSLSTIGSDVARLTTLSGCPHDAQMQGSDLWATTTDGLVHRLGQTGNAPSKPYDVFSSSGRSGWCRGLHVDEQTIAVGLTRIDHMPRLRWCDRPFERTETAFVLLERVSGRLLGSIPLRDLGPRTKLFAIVPAEPEATS